MTEGHAASVFAGVGALPRINIAKLLAPFQYGLVFSWGLLGVLIHQVYVYNMRFAQKDAAVFKILVHVVLVVEIVSVGIMTDLIHYLVVGNWGDLPALVRMPWSTRALALSTSTTALIVQLFFLWRVWKINHEVKILRFLALLMVPVAFTHFGCSIALTSLTPLGFATRNVKNVAGLVVELALAAGFVCDIGITGLMVLSLLRLRKESADVKSTAATINTLIVRAIETGAVTTVVAFIELMLFENKRINENNYFLAAHIVLGRLYSTMLLANLNGRGYFSGAHDTSELRSIRMDFGVELDTSIGSGPASRPGARATSMSKL